MNGATLEELTDEPPELLAPLLDAAAIEEPEEADELEEPAEVGALGWKVLFLAPKPTFDAKTPPTEIGTVLFLAVRTRWPLVLSDAVTFASLATFGLLMALIRSPTVSVPDDA